MTDREIVVHLAEKVMGWKVRNVDAVSGSKEVIAIRDASGRDRIWYPGCGNRYWNPMESRDDCSEVEAALEAGKIDRYIEALLDGWPKSGFNEYWWLIQLTPRQRCLAIVEATK